MVQSEPAAEAENPAGRPDRGALYAIWAAALVSGSGRMLSAVAVPWAVWHTSGSVGSAGAVVTFSSFGMALVAFLSGPLLDRVGNGRAAVLGLLTAGAAMALIPALYVTGTLRLWHVLLLAFIASGCDSAAEVAVRTLIPRAAERARMPLESANSVFAAIDRLTLLIVPVLAGAAIALTSAEAVLWADAAACALAALVLLAALRALGRRPEPQAAATERGGYLGELTDGVRTITGDPVLRTVGLTAAAANALAGSLYTVVLIAYAAEVSESAGAYAAMMAALGGGALIGAIGFGVYGPRLPRRACYLLGYLGGGLSTLLLATMPGTVATLAILVLSGLSLAPIGPLMATVYQERTAEEERGRVFSAQNALGLAAVALGTVAASAALGAVGLRFSILVIAGLELAIAAVSLALPSLRRLDETRAPAGGAEAGEPAAGEEPAAVEEPTGDEAPAVIAEPVTEPVAEEPAATAEAAAPEEPAAEEPAAPEEPAAEEPTAAEKSEPSEKPEPPGQSAPRAAGRKVARKGARTATRATARKPVRKAAPPKPARAAEPVRAAEEETAEPGAGAARAAETAVEEVR
ncbi:MFS transporter [Kitasatospora sp. NPDC004240]